MQFTHHLRVKRNRVIELRRYTNRKKLYIFALACLKSPYCDSLFPSLLSLYFFLFPSLFQRSNFHIVKWSKWFCARMPEAFDLKRMRNHLGKTDLYCNEVWDTKCLFSFFFLSVLSLFYSLLFFWFPFSLTEAYVSALKRGCASVSIIDEEESRKKCMFVDEMSQIIGQLVNIIYRFIN